MTDGPTAIPTKMQDVLDDIESQWNNQIELQLEAEMSINEWVDRVRGYATAAHQFARAGAPLEEYKAWAELAAVCASRMLIVEASIPPS